mgnify:FL=1
MILQKFIINLQNLSFTCSVNEDIRQQGNTCDMLFPISSLISILSGWWVLRPGDIIYTGTPSGVGPLEPGDKVYIESPAIGSFSWTLGY